MTLEPFRWIIALKKRRELSALLEFLAKLTPEPIP